MVKLLSLSAIEPLLTIRITLLNGYSFKNIMQMTANFAVVGCNLRPCCVLITLFLSPLAKKFGKSSKEKSKSVKQR